jgi:hypothetical protein
MDYSQLPTVSPTATVFVSNLSAEEEVQFSRSSRWYFFFCLFQMVIATLSLLSGAIPSMILTIVFVSIGLSGLRHRRPKMLAAHFVFSVVVYIFSLMSVVFAIMNGQEFSLAFYLIAFFFILIQAVGLRHTKNLIHLTKKMECAHIYNLQGELAESSTQTQTQANESAQSQETQTPPPVGSAPQYFYPMALPPQYYPGGVYPMQPIRYPIVQQPVSLVPQYTNDASAPPAYTKE